MNDLSDFLAPVVWPCICVPVAFLACVSVIFILRSFALPYPYEFRPVRSFATALYIFTCLRVRSCCTVPLKTYTTCATACFVSTFWCVHCSYAPCMHFVLWFVCCCCMFTLLIHLRVRRVNSACLLLVYDISPRVRSQCDAYCSSWRSFVCVRVLRSLVFVRKVLLILLYTYLVPGMNFLELRGRCCMICCMISFLD